MNQQPFFSIITVCRNEERNIHLTADSVVAQTYKNYEWLVLDGKSTDKTVKILQQYKKNMTYFASKKDKGIYDAMNEAIKKSRGKYLIFMNGGDLFYKKDILQKAHQFIMNDNHKHKIYFGTSMLHDDNIRHLYESPRTVKYKIGRGVKKGYFFDETLFHQSTFINKELFDKYGGYNTHYCFAADLEWFIRSIKEKNIYMDMIVSIFDMSGWHHRMGNPVLGAIEFTKRKEIQFTYYSIFFLCLKFLQHLMIDIYLYKYSFLQKAWRVFKKIIKK